MPNNGKKFAVPTPAVAASGFVGEKAIQYARKYSEETPAGYALRVRRERVLALFDKPGGMVLDVGCGPGEMARELLDMGCEFWGVDPSRQMIDICNSRFGIARNTHFLLGDARKLDFPDNHFDALLCMGVIDALSDVRQAVREMVRVLKPNGTLIVSFANRHSPYAWWKANVYYRLLAICRHVTHPRVKADPIFARRHLFTATTATELLQSTNTRVEKVVGYFYNLLLPPLDEFLPRPTLWLNKQFEERPASEPDWRAAGFIIKAMKLG